MPDDARERLRRAQHPGHRRQAHPADPQRHEHRCRRRRSATGPPTSSTCCSTRPPAAPTSPTARALRRAHRTRSSTSASRRICNVLAAIKTAKAARPRPRRRDDHRRHRRRRALPERAGQDPRRSDFGGELHRRRRRGGLRRAPRRRHHRPRRSSCTERDRNRIFNLGYYTWVEQQGTPFELFEARRDQDFWRGLRRYLPVWDELITEFNARVAARLMPRLSTVARAALRCAVCGASVDIAEPLAVALPERDRRRPSPRAATRLEHRRHCELADRRPTRSSRFAAIPGVGRLGARARPDRRRVHRARRASSTRASPRSPGRGSASPRSRAPTRSARARLRRRRWCLGEGRDRTTSAGSHKARHLFTILLHLATAECRAVRRGRRRPERPPLAIASCGNAALAASTLAAAVRLADPGVRAAVGQRARCWPACAELGADVVVCPRRSTRSARRPVRAPVPRGGRRGCGAVQRAGPGNALCLDGGRRSAGRWRRSARGRGRFDRLFVQVGGGALAACVGCRLALAGVAGARSHAVQTEACAPLARAWARAGSCRWARGRRRALGPSACGRGSRGAPRPPTASSTTRPTTGCGARGDGRGGGSPVVVGGAARAGGQRAGLRATGIDARPHGHGRAGRVAGAAPLGADERRA